MPSVALLLLARIFSFFTICFQVANLRILFLSSKYTPNFCIREFRISAFLLLPLGMLVLVVVRSVGGVLVLVPEEVLTLSELLLLRLGGEDGLEGVGIETGVVHLGGGGHGGWSEVLHLFEFVPHLLGEVCELRHVLIAASGM